MLDEDESATPHDDETAEGSPAIWDTAAFYLTPAVWIKDARDDTGITGYEEVLREELPRGITATVSRDGLFSFIFSGSEYGLVPPIEMPFEETAHAVMRRRLQILNVHLACLYTACFRNQDAMRPKVTLAHTDLILFSSSEPSEMQIHNFPMAVFVLSQRPPTAQKAQEAVACFNRAANRENHAIALQSVIDSFDQLRSILQQEEPTALRFADLPLQSCGAIEQSNYDQSLILSWAVTEKVLVTFWDRYLQHMQKHPRNDSAIAKAFSAHARWQATGHTPNFRRMLDFLLNQNAIPTSLGVELEDAQQARDEWLHRLEPISKARAVASLTLAQQMLHLIDGVQFHLFPWEEVCFGYTVINYFYVQADISADAPITFTIPGSPDAKRIDQASLDVKMRPYLQMRGTPPREV